MIKKKKTDIEKPKKKYSNNSNPFRFLHHLKYNKPLTEEELKEFNVYLMNRMYYFAGHERFCNLINHLWTLPKEWQFKLMASLFKGLRTSKWIKKGTSQKYEEIVIEFLMKKYECSTRKARQYYNLLDKKEIKEIKKVYK